MSPVTRARLAKAAALGAFIGLLVGVATFDVWSGVLAFVLVVIGFGLGDAVAARGAASDRGEQTISDDREETACQRRTTMILLAVATGLALLLVVLASRRLGLW